MSDAGDRDGTLPPDEDPATGRPIDVLAGLGQPPSAGFMGRLQRALGRRSFAGQIAVFTWELPKLLFLELLDLVFYLIGPDVRRRKGGNR